MLNTNEKRTKNTIIPAITGITDSTSIVKRFKDMYNETRVKVILITTVYKV